MSIEKGQISNSPYLELLKKVLIDFDSIGNYEYHPLHQVNPNWKTFLLYPLDSLLRARNFSINKMMKVEKNRRLNGLDWPARAKTMIGYHRLTNLEDCIRKIKKENIEGDIIETGVWRGGAAIFMKAVLNELNLRNKTLWLADSFKGLPSPSHPADKESKLHKLRILSATKQEVKENFQKLDLLDDKVKFIEGWFKDTLHNTPIEKLSLLRLDGDLYESTILALEHLYPKLSIGGYLIVDDYNAFPFCKKAVDDYRTKNNIKEPIINIDTEAVFWKKEN